MPVRVLLADSNTLVRSLLREALTTDDLMAVDDVADLDTLLTRCACDPPHVVVTNADLPGGPIDDHIGTLAGDGARVLVFTTDPSPERVTTLLAAGVSGYLLREVDPDGVLHAVRAVAAGEIVLHPAVASTVVEQWRRLRAGGRIANGRTGLTPREVDVLVAMADGLSTKAIARRLGVAAKTIENHKTRVFDKLGARTQAHAVATAINQGLLTARPMAESI